MSTDHVHVDAQARRIAQARRERLPCADLGNGYFANPLMVGPGADNTIVRVDDDYYMMAGGGWPDQLVWHSRDLINWRPLTRALRKWDGRAWASDLTYYDGRFFIYTTQVDRERGNTGQVNLAHRSLRDKDRGFMNVVLWADDPAGPWSEPINLNVYGLIDPGHVVDREGNRFLYFNKGMVVPLTKDGLSTAGEVRQVYDGWHYPSNWVVECMCLEAPKLTYHNGFYYLVSAQGGTSGPSTAHMAVVARATTPVGPWQNSPHNPLVRTQSRHEQWWRQGHGTLIDDPDGRWWLLYTGYEKGYTFLGKQSLLLPVEWTADGWPRVEPGVTPTALFRKPSGDNVGHGMPLSDEFTDPELGIQWMWSPEVDPHAAFQVGGGKLRLQACGDLPPEATALSVMPLNHAYEVTVKATIAGGAGSGAEGGLLVAPRSPQSFWACAGLHAGQAFAKWPRVPSTIDWSEPTIWLRIRSDHGDVACYYSMDGEAWTKFPNSTRVADIHRAALYAAGQGEVIFEHFAYRGLD